jgi:hypothetical protein
MCATSVRDFNASLLEHDPEKWKPVFRKDRAQTEHWNRMTIRGKGIPLEGEMASTRAQMGRNPQPKTMPAPLHCLGGRLAGSLRGWVV